MLTNLIILFAAALIIWDRITIERMAYRHLVVSEALLTRIHAYSPAFEKEEEETP